MEGVLVVKGFGGLPGGWLYHQYLRDLMKEKSARGFKKRKKIKGYGKKCP